MPSIPQPRGGGHGLRRTASAAAVVLLAVFALPTAGPGTAAGAARDSEPTVTVREKDNTYSVAASFHVLQPPAVALAVLTDYEQIPRFMPGVTSSIVRERSAERVVIEQEAVSRMLMFSKQVHLLLEVIERSDSLRFRDVAGRSFAVYEGAWTLRWLGERTAVLYELRAKPTFDVPAFLLKRLLARDARTMIERLQEEIASRVLEPVAKETDLTASPPFAARS